MASSAVRRPHRRCNSRKRAMRRGRRAARIGASVSTASPPASMTQTTGATNQPPAVKQMNEEEKQKVEKEGK